MSVTDPTLPQLWDDDRGTLARRTDPITSHQAADQINESARRILQDTIWLLLLEQPSTDAELTARYFSTPGRTDHVDSVRKRRADLLNLGKVRASNITRLTPTGRKAIVWEVVNV